MKPFIRSPRVAILITWVLQVATAITMGLAILSGVIAFQFGQWVMFGGTVVVLIVCFGVFIFMFEVRDSWREVAGPNARPIERRQI